MDTPANQIPSFSYDVRPMDIGSGYAAGIAQAGEGLAKGIGAAFDVATQNRTADDTLQAMVQSKMLSPEAYQAVAGKSLGAKQAILGMHASQWIAQMAQERELQKIGFTGATQRTTAMGEMLDRLSVLQGGSAAAAYAAGLDPRKLPIGGVGAGTGGQPGNAQAVQRAQLVRSPTPVQAAAAATVNPAIAAPGTPLTTQTSQPPLVIGNPIGWKENIPKGATLHQAPNGQPGWLSADKGTWWPQLPPPPPPSQTATTAQIMSGGT